VKVGLLSQDEDYWSLDAVTLAAVDVLTRAFLTTHYRWHRGEEYQPRRMREVFAGSDVVVSLGSRAPRFDRCCDTPAVFLAHAWMDHAAGVNLVANERFFRRADTLTFASRPALLKYHTIFEDGPTGVLLPYFVPGLQAAQVGRIVGDGAGERHRLAVRYRLPARQKWVLAAGRLSDEKNTPGLVRMWRRLQRTDSVLVLAGSLTTLATAGFPAGDGGRQTVAALHAVSTGAMEGVRWIGPVSRSDLNAMMRQAYVLAHPTLSYEEDFGLVAAEAMAAGVPVVCSDWGGLKDVVVHGEGGLRARTWLAGGRVHLDEEEYCRWLAAVLNDAQLRRRLSAGAARLARRNYTEQVFATRLEGIVRQTRERVTQVRGPARLRPIPVVQTALRAAATGPGLDAIYADARLVELLFRAYASS